MFFMLNYNQMSLVLLSNKSVSIITKRDINITTVDCCLFFCHTENL